MTSAKTPEQLADAIAAHASDGSCVLVDCLTLWLSNWLMKDDDALWQRVRAEFLYGIQRAPGQLILVSNEVGQGVVPMGALSRRFVDEAGRLHQELAAVSERVVLVTAGLEQVLKAPH